jgi:hypothetical protein
VGSLVAIVVPVAVLALVVALAWAASRGGGKLLAARNAKLTEVAGSLGLTVRAVPHPHLFSAEGTTPTGVPLRLGIDRVLRSGRGGSNRWLLRLAGRPLGPRPALLVRHRLRGGELGEPTPSLHEISTGDEDFDTAFFTFVEDDAAALRVLGAPVRAGLLALGTKLSAIQSLRVGGEVALAFDFTFDHTFTRSTSARPHRARGGSSASRCTTTSAPRCASSRSRPRWSAPCRSPSSSS